MRRVLLAACVVLWFDARLLPADEPVPASADGVARGENQSPLEAPPCKMPCITLRPSCNRWWGGADYLLWWFKDAPSPTPLVISGPTDSTFLPVLGEPGTNVVLGGTAVAPGAHSGGRFTMGRWLDANQTFGVEGTFFFLGNRSVSQSVGSSGAAGSPLLALPFYDPTLPGENSTGIAIPEVFSGTAVLTTASRFQGWEATGVWNRSSSGRFRREWLGGFRYLNLTEEYSLATNSPFIDVPEDVFQTLDDFKTRNNFYGAQAGIRGEYRGARWLIQGTGKLAMGNMHETVYVNGGLLTNEFNNLGQAQALQGGYLAQPTNIGRQSYNRFAVIPELNLNVGYQIAQRLRARIGYSFLYVSSVARPGNQVDRVINPSQAPSLTGEPGSPLVGPARPAPLFHPSDFWAQGINFGLELTY